VKKVSFERRMKKRRSYGW